MISALVLFSSSMGILAKSTYIRETSTWASQAKAQDMADVVAVVILLLATYFMSKGSVRAWQTWAGTLMFLAYAFVIYAFAAHFNELFLVYVATLGLLFYTLLGGVLKLDFDRLSGATHMSEGLKRIVSIVLIIIGLLFYFLWLSEDIPALLNGSVPASVIQTGLLVNPIHVLDMAFYLPAIIITGISLWRSKSLGFVLALPMIVFSVLTGFGIFLIMIAG